MRLRMGLVATLLAAASLGGSVAAHAAACDGDDFAGTWCKRAVEDTDPVEYTIEFTVTTTGSAGVVGMVTATPGKAGNMGTGKASTNESKGTAKGTEKTKITGSTTLKLQAKDGNTPPCSPPATEKQGNCGATSGDQVIPTCP